MADKTEADYIPRWRRTSDTNKELEYISTNGPIGSIDSALGNVLSGINHQGTPGAVPTNKDHHGLTFFTRPLMNMTSNNLRMNRIMASLLSTDSSSIQRYIRCMLDPRLAKAIENPITSTFCKPDQAFIPVLTNALLSIGGWRDIAPATFEAPAGSHKESYSHFDGISDDYSTYDIQATFRNIDGDPITYMMLLWVHYGSLVYRGHMVPYPDLLIENEIDYQTRIYRLVLDPTKTKVRKIGATGASYPIHSPTGQAFNFEAQTPYNLANESITITFKSHGNLVFDPILAWEFNQVVEMFNPNMKDANRARTMVRIHPDRAQLFNNNAYYRINLDNWDFEIYVPEAVYTSVMGGDETVGTMIQTQPEGELNLPPDLELPGPMDPDEDEQGT